MRIKGNSEWIKINNNRYLFIAINIEKIQDKNISIFAKIQFNVDARLIFGSVDAKCVYYIWEVNSLDNISTEFLNGIEDYVFELK